ncbi:MAG: hypothetical protein SGPRY_008200 [Prymnesium sp.]
MLEVRWRYTHKDTGAPVYIWCEGEAADGEKDKRSARCTKILPASALRIKRPADVELDEQESFTWTVLLKLCAFNKDVHLGWRFGASELESIDKEAETSKPKRRAENRKEKQSKSRGANA